MPIEWTLPPVDCSKEWRNRDHESRMVLIGVMARHWLKYL